jgi:hypothetical protein
LFASFPSFGNPSEMWHDIGKRIVEYTDALLDAFNPRGSASRQGQHRDRPRWDGVRLSYGNIELRNYRRKSAPEQAAVLAAMEKANWPDHAVRLPEACWPNLNTTLRHINEKIKNGLIRLSAAGDGRSVIWHKSVKKQ